MNADDITRSLIADRYNRSFVLPRYTPYGWWECDVFEVTAAGYFREYEIKISRSDFFADAKKDRTVYPLPCGAERKTENKHELLEGSMRGPTQFYYVTPAGLIKPEEIPEWAGLIEADDRPGHPPPWRVSTREVKRAPRRHNEKMDAKIMNHARGVTYYRMHSALFGLASAETAEATA